MISEKRLKEKSEYHNVLFGSDCIWSVCSKYRLRKIVLYLRKEKNDLIKRAWVGDVEAYFKSTRI